MKASIKKTFHNYLKFRSWHTSRKIVVIESDDWGTIRMPSKQAYDFFLKKGYEVDKCPYNANDCLENNTDLEELFNVLSNHKDIKDIPPIFTCNNIVANPDFEKIKESNFSQYFYEPFTETLKKYPEHDRVMPLYKSGIANKLVNIEFHGREHLNVKRWMTDLQKGNTVLSKIFDWNMFTIHEKGIPLGRKEYLDAFGNTSEEDHKVFREMLLSGHGLFQKIWGKFPSSFIAPCYTWSNKLEPILDEINIHSIQGTHVQREPIHNESSKIKRRYHFTGQKNRFKQRFLVRNALFEPAENPEKDWITSCLHQIDTAFKWKTPAIISSHRVNYIGSINPINREKNLRLLDKLIQEILKKHPTIEFMTSSELAQLI